MKINVALFGVLAVVCIQYQSLAQEDSVAVKKITYYNSFVNGVLIGCGTCNAGKDFTYSALTLHGIKLASGVKFSAGVGMDVYSNWRLFPVVAGITLDAERKRNSLYFHVNAGHAWGRYLLRRNDWWSPSIVEKGGFTINPMLGYRIGNERMRLYMQAGYKLQLAYVWETYQQGWGGGYTSFREYELNRVVVQIGFGMN